MKRNRTVQRQPLKQPAHSATQAQNAGYRFAILTFFAIFLILILVGLTFMVQGVGNTYQTVELEALKNAEQSVFLYPTSSDSLVKGKTYTLRWEGGPPAIQEMFLINKALQKEGVSVSIADRAYNIKNTGSYTLTIPTNIPDGLYRIEAGPLVSEYFEITSK